MQNIRYPEFQMYQELSQSGEINMFNVFEVSRRLGISLEKVKNIHQNHEKLSKKWRS
jgi:hypothetical protein